MKLRHWLIILAVGAMLAGCEGDEGPVGPTGPSGDGSGFTYAYPGDVATADGAVGAGQLVLLRALDRDGRPVADIGSCSTLADGTFSMGSMVDAAATPLGLDAMVGDSFLRAFLVDTDGQSVSPVTEGVVDLVTMVTGTPEGRTLEDYPAEDIRTLVAAAEAALTTAGTDLSDPEAVRNQLLTDIGGQLADLSGGTYAIQPSSSPVAMDPPDVLTDVASFYVELTDGDGELWDIDGDGSVSDGTSDSYDTMFELTVGASSFPDQSAPSATARIEDGREVVLGPVVDLDGSGLDVTRKIYVPENGSFARFAEILVNNSGADVTIDVLVDGNLGSDESTDAVQNSSSGDTTVDAADVWMTMKWDDDPTVGFFFPGATPAKSSDDVQYGWTDVVVPAGQTVVLLHWGFQGSSKLPAAMAAELALIEDSIPGEMFTGLTVAEAVADPFVAGADNAIGEAGSVAPLAAVSLDNLTSGSSAAVDAAPDGSFAAFLAETDSGDQVHVTASDGTDETVTVP